MEIRASIGELRYDWNKGLVEFGPLLKRLVDELVQADRLEFALVRSRGDDQGVFRIAREVRHRVREDTSVDSQGACGQDAVAGGRFVWGLDLDSKHRVFALGLLDDVLDPSPFAQGPRKAQRAGVPIPPTAQFREGLWRRF